VNPHRIEGQKTMAFEICDALGRAPDVNITPVGNAGNITAQWKGYREYHHMGRIARLPHMLGFQAEGAAPIVRGRVVPNPRTVATAIRIGNPASWQGATAAAQESHGFIRAVSDREILEAYRLLAAQDGIFAEPASAASVAGLLKLAKTGYFRSVKRSGKAPLTVVCVLTGHGLKDPERAIKSIRLGKPLPPSLSVISKAVGLK
jgi:threonine synthase